MICKKYSLEFFGYKLARDGAGEIRSGGGRPGRAVEAMNCFSSASFQRFQAETKLVIFWR